MADGATYPARFENEYGQVVLGVDLTFTDDSNQPEPGGGGGGPANPYAPATGDDVTVLTDSTGAHILIAGGDDASGAYLQSIDGMVKFEVSNSGSSTAGTITSGAAVNANEVPQLSQLTSAQTITSGTLPNTGSWVSGTAKQNPVTRQITVNVECVFDGTANAATVGIAISPDDSTYTTVGTPGVSAAVNTVGTTTLLVPVNLPAGWFIKLTIAAHASVAASIYY